ncbi:MAG: hypothetical protein Q8908_16090 [Bacteroidota bacterium]|nr:hypothetical protein [Bacteroidota bacterium]
MHKFIFIPLILLFGCVTVKNSVSSSWEPKSKSNDFPYFDQGLNVHYQIYNDNSNLHVKFTTTDYALINKIVSTGLRVCFDVKGRMNEKEYLEYPLYRKQVFSDQIMTQSYRSQKNNVQLSDLLPQIPEEAIFHNHDEILRFPVKSNDGGIKVSITQRRSNAIVYDLIIPIERISKGGLPALSKLSVGIVTAEKNQPTISGSFPDISGKDARGDAPISDRYGNRIESGNTFGTSGGGGTFGSGGHVSKTTTSARIQPVDRFNRNRRYVAQKPTEYWVKVDLKKS